jgi:hypothetical protein
MRNIDSVTAVRHRALSGGVQSPHGPVGAGGGHPNTYFDWLPDHVSTLAVPAQVCMGSSWRPSQRQKADGFNPDEGLRNLQESDGGK